jgi:hypothetical protein
MITREEAKAYLTEIDSAGWLRLIDLLYDKLPPEIEITEVFQKWGHFEVRYKGENEKFRKYLYVLKRISERMCERCGKLATETIVGSLVETLCKEHFEWELKNRQSVEYYYPEVYPDL